MKKTFKDLEVKGQRRIETQCGDTHMCHIWYANVKERTIMGNM